MFGTSSLAKDHRVVNKCLLRNAQTWARVIQGRSADSWAVLVGVIKSLSIHSKLVLSVTKVSYRACKVSGRWPQTQTYHNEVDNGRSTHSTYCSARVDILLWRLRLWGLSKSVYNWTGIFQLIYLTKTMTSPFTIYRLWSLRGSGPFTDSGYVKDLSYTFTPIHGRFREWIYWQQTYW